MKNNYYKLLAIFILLTNLTGVNAQINAYTFTTSTGVALEDMSSGTTTLVAGGIDDGVSAVTNIGFTFNYNCTAYSQFSVNGNGLMRLGGTVVSNAYSNSLANGANDPKITALWDDLSTATVASGGKVHYKLFGSAPNRYLVVEWRVYNTSSTASAYNTTFQVVLYESTDIIKFIYGTVTASSSYSVGITSSATDYISVTTSTNTASTSSVNNSQNAAITSGRSYSFTPATGSGPMAYSTSVATTASIQSVQKCATSQEIIALKVTTTGCSSTINLTQIQLNMNGSTAPLSDVSKIHIYYTGASSSYLGTNAFDGTAGTTPASGTITVNGNQALVGGDNYFWIVYDINPSATTNNVVDAQCTQITIGGSNYIPTTTAPAGSRPIIDCASTVIANYGLTSNLVDATGNNTNATMSGTATGPSASGVCLDGVYGSTNVQTPTISLLTANNFQVEVDFTLNSFGHSILVGGGGYRWIGISVNAGGYLQVFWNNSNYATTTTLLSLSTTYSAKLVFANGVLWLYLNDVLVYQNSSLPSPLNHNNEFYFLTTNYSNGLVIDGCIQNLIVSNNTTPIVLPVDLLSFNTSCVGVRSKINWKTASENNNDYFTIEKSLDAIHFEPVGVIKGAGDSYSEKSYTYTDPQANENKTVYYKLKQTDYDGEEKYLNTRSIRCLDESNDLKITNIIQYADGMELEFISPIKGNHMILIYDEMGKEILSRTLNVNEKYNVIKLDFQTMQTMYIISLQNSNKRVSGKFVGH